MSKEASSDEQSLGPPLSISLPRRPRRRLLFDRRYGWIFDEWKDPSEEALVGGRGMFCILPIGKSLIDLVSLSINFAANNIIRSLKTPDQLSPQTLRNRFHTCIQKVVCSVQGMELKSMHSSQSNFIFKRPGGAEQD